MGADRWRQDRCVPYLPLQSSNMHLTKDDRAGIKSHSQQRPIVWLSSVHGLLGENYKHVCASCSLGTVGHGPVVLASMTITCD